MTDRIRTLSDDALQLHRESFEFTLRQSELAREQANSLFSMGRASLEATRDLQQAMVKNWVHAFAPAKDAAKA